MNECQVLFILIGMLILIVAILFIKVTRLENELFDKKNDD